jgi:hypothetical protein
MENLAQTLKQTIIEEYAGGGVNLKTFPMMNDEEQAYAVLIVDTPLHKKEADILIFARLVGDYVVIEANTTDHPLEDVLVYKGLPRERIICAYAGEPLPQMN